MLCVASRLSYPLIERHMMNITRMVDYTAGDADTDLDAAERLKKPS